MDPRTQVHPRQTDWAILTNSWTLSLRADGYAALTLHAYTRAVRLFTEWLAVDYPDVGPTEVTRTHVREWIVATREATSSGTARSHFAGLRHFCRWMLAEGEADADPTEGIKTPAANETRTELLKKEEIRALLDTAKGRDFRNLRDTAIIYVFAYGGLRLSECASLRLDSVDQVACTIDVRGKGTNRSGKRTRTIHLRNDEDPMRALDRYIRIRRHHPYANTEPLWLGDRKRPTLSGDGIDAMLQRRADQAGLGHIHPHQFRHTWADAYRTAGGPDGDLMQAGGWRSRTMLDRYGKAGAEARAAETARRIKLYGGKL